MKSSTLTLALLILLSTSFAQKIDTKSDEQTLLNIWKDWPKLAATGETDKILTYWADDAVIMSPGQPTISGIKEIKNMIEGSKHIPGFKMVWDPEPISITVSKCGDLAYIIAKNHFTMNDPSGKPVTQDNRALLIWKKQSDNNWKESVVMFNSEVALK
jgi:ketosteroid isomerase-like protein